MRLTLLAAFLIGVLGISLALTLNLVLGYAPQWSLLLPASVVLLAPVFVWWRAGRRGSRS